MRFIIVGVAASTLFASIAVAQPPAAQNGPPNPAVKTSTDNNSTNPVAGANSFTRSEARSAIRAKGYTNIAGLTKDQSGVWRGTATMDGKSGPVSVDYQGNVN